jgi:pyruvoyl-dependent arginine decarboxylase
MTPVGIRRKGGIDLMPSPRGRISLDVSTYVPAEAFLTRGVGKHKEKLASFELALRDAGIAHLNLVRVSSIFPPYCKLISKDKGLEQILPGQIIHVVISENEANEPHRLMSAAVGIAIPRDRAKYGYLSEHHSFGETDRVAGEPRICSRRSWGSPSSTPTRATTKRRTSGGCPDRS